VDVSTWLNKMMERRRCDSGGELNSSKIHNAGSKRLRQRLQVREKRIYQSNLVDL